MNIPSLLLIRSRRDGGIQQGEMSMNRRSRLYAWGIGIVILSIAAGPVLADPLPGKHPVLNKRVTINGGGFFADIDSKIRLDSETLGIGSTIDFEDELGLEETKDTGWINLHWRISRRNNLEFEWANLDRNAEVAGTTRAYQIGEEVVQAGAAIGSVFDIDIYRLTYGYSLIRNDEADVQLKAGLHLADLETALTLNGVISVSGMPFSQQIVQEREDVTAPLPHFGGNFMYAFNEKFAIFGHVMGFALELDDIEGSIVDASGTVQYNFTPNFGLGAGLRFTRIDVESGDAELRGKFKFDYLGPVVYASLSF